MSIACPEMQRPVLYRSSSASIEVPPPPMAIRGSTSVSRPNSERSGLLLGSALLVEDPLFSAFFQEVKALQMDPDEDAPPDDYALAEVLRLVPFSRNQLAQDWYKPSVTSDGFGGVRLSWRRGQCEVRVVISGAQTARKSYLYWESGDTYGTVQDFTPATLLAYLRHHGEGGGA
jgi:hypothetical protein